MPSLVVGREVFRRRTRHIVGAALIAHVVVVIERRHGENQSGVKRVQPRKQYKPVPLLVGIAQKFPGRIVGIVGIERNLVVVLPQLGLQPQLVLRIHIVGQGAEAAVAIGLIMDYRRCWCLQSQIRAVAVQARIVCEIGWYVRRNSTGRRFARNSPR